MSMDIHVDRRARGAGKSHDLALAVIDHVANVALDTDDPPRVRAVLVVKEGRRNMDGCLGDMLAPYRRHVVTVSATTDGLERTRGVDSVPWFADDFDLFPDGLQPVLRAAIERRAPSLTATVTCNHIAARGAREGEVSDGGWVCTDCGMPDPHAGELL